MDDELKLSAAKALGEAAELRALRELRVAVGANCERLPEEVRRTLHRVPDIERTHSCALLRAEIDAQWEHNRAKLARAEEWGLI